MWIQPLGYCARAGNRTRSVHLSPFAIVITPSNRIQSKHRLRTILLPSLIDAGRRKMNRKETSRIGILCGILSVGRICDLLKPVVWHSWINDAVEHVVEAALVRH